MEFNKNLQEVTSLGNRIVMDVGLAMVMFEYLEPEEQTRMQPLNKRMQHRICGLNMGTMQLAKDTLESEYLAWGALNKYDVKRVENIEINGYTGYYCGEISKESGQLEGNGVFYSNEILILGGFLNGKFNPCRKSIVYDSTND